MLTQNFAPGLGKGKIYEPKIYGFRVSERSKSGPRMQWLRMKPDDITELDEIGRRNAQREQQSDDEEDQQNTEKAVVRSQRSPTRQKARMRTRRRPSPSMINDQNGGRDG